MINNTDLRKDRIRANRAHRQRHELAMLVSEPRRRFHLMLFLFCLVMAWLCLAGAALALKAM